jgi:DNA-binding GntR family transcriptional regulator
VGTANMHFHMALAALAVSRRVDELMRQLLAELRLVFHVMDDPRTFHEPYLSHNERISTLLEAGKIELAAHELLGYLRTAERQLVEAYEGTPAVAS